MQTPPQGKQTNPAEKKAVRKCVSFYQQASPSPSHVLSLRGKIGPVSSDRVYRAACAAIRMHYINN